MDGFDDLLAPSRHALEDNPFADPFQKDRSSPDPWATPFAATEPQGFGSTSIEHSQSLDSYGSLSNNEFGASSSEFKPLDGSPVDAPAHTVDDDENDDNEPLGRIRSPGFRQNMAASFLETATIRPTTTEDYPSLTSAATTIQNNFDNPSPSTWQTETQTPWQSEHPIPIPTKIAQSDEDSDDDKPIIQTLKHYDQDDSAPVSVYTVTSMSAHFFSKDTSSHKSNSR